LSYLTLGQTATRQAQRQSAKPGEAMGTPERTDNQEKLPNILGLATPKPERSAQQPKPARQPGKSYLTFLHLADKTPTRAWRMGAPGATERRRRTKRPEPAKPKAQNAMHQSRRPKASKAAAHMAQRTRHAQQNRRAQQRARHTPTARRKTDWSESEKKTPTPIFFLAVKRTNRKPKNVPERKRKENPANHFFFSR